MLRGFGRGSSIGARWFSSGKNEINDLIAADIKEYPVMVYMKEKQKLRLFGDRVSHFEQGTPEAPQCGFSKRAVQILQTVGVEFASRDVLQDPELREGVKKFSNWPTIPQVFIGGEFVGGSDTLLEMMKAGDLDKILDEKKVKRIAQEKQ